MSPSARKISKAASPPRLKGAVVPLSISTSRRREFLSYGAMCVYVLRATTEPLPCYTFTFLTIVERHTRRGERAHFGHLFSSLTLSLLISERDNIAKRDTPRVLVEIYVAEALIHITSLFFIEVRKTCIAATWCDFSRYEVTGFRSLSF